MRISTEADGDRSPGERGLRRGGADRPAVAPAGGPGGGFSKSADVTDLETRMMAFDANKDGKLTREEVTDERLLRLFERADADKDGTVTKAELVALGEKEHVDDQGGPPGGRPGFGGPGFGGPGGPPSRPGEVLSAMFQQRLVLSDEQQEQVAKLQAEVDARLEKILTEDQRSQLRAARQRGPGGPGGGPPGGGRRQADPAVPVEGPPAAGRALAEWGGFRTGRRTRRGRALEGDRPRARGGLFWGQVSVRIKVRRPSSARSGGGPARRAGRRRTAS